MNGFNKVAMLEFLHRRILLPAYETGLKQRRVFRYLKELEESQWYGEKEIERRQIESLRTLLTHAATTCPYYRDLWKSRGFDAGSLESADDFRRWPLMDRETIRENRVNMRSTAPGIKLLSKSTGGSTGVPLHFDYDTDSLDRRFAAWHRGYGWAGAAPGTKQFYFWGVPLGNRSTRQRLKDGLYNRLYRRRLVSSFGFREETARTLIGEYNRYRPEILVAYTNPLYYLARALEEQKIRPYAPKSIVVGAEKLHDFQRRCIERVFQAPVFETYGTREFMLLGAECDNHQGLHLTAENCYLEIVDDDGQPTPDGEEGNVAVTDLTNYGMPFIRYLNGDRAAAGFSRCKCGRGLPLVSQITGRRLDVIRTLDGRLVPGEFFPHLLKDFPAVRRFQVVQTDSDRVEVRVVLESSWSSEEHAKLSQEIDRALGPTMHWELVPVERVETTAMGKHRVVIGLDNGTHTATRGHSQDLQLAKPPST